MILEGVIGIVEGLNPTLIRMKLESYNPHAPETQEGQARKGGRGARGQTRLCGCAGDQTGGSRPRRPPPRREGGHETEQARGARKSRALAGFLR